MNDQRIKVLLVEDNPGDARLIRETLTSPTSVKSNGFAIDLVHADRLSAGLDRLSRQEFDVVLLDLGLPDSQGLETFTSVQRQAPNVPVVILTGNQDDDLAIRAVREGAQDFLLKGVAEGQLVQRYIRHAVDRQKMLARLERQKRELEASESRLQTIINTNIDGLAVLGEDGSIRFMNPAAAAIMEWKKEEMQGWSFDFPVAAGEKSEVNITANGSSRTVETQAVRINWEGESGLLASLRDITEQKKAEEEIRRINRALQMVSGCNQTLIHATNEEELLKEICRILVDLGGYRLAWAGFAEHDKEKTIRPVVHHGYDAGYLNTIKLSWSGNTWGQGPAGMAIRTRVPISVEDINTDPVFESWRPEALKHGFVSFVALPLIDGEEVLGVLCIYSGEANAFSLDEIAILVELAGDLSYGIRVIRTKAEHNRAQEELQQAAVEMRRLVSHLEITNKIAKAASSTLEPVELFRSIVDEIRRAVPCDRVLIASLAPEYGSYIYLFEEEGDRFESMSGYSGRAGLISAKAYETKQPVNIPDLQIDAWRETHHAKLGFRSALAIPIVQEGRCIAHVHLSSKRSHFFGTDDEALLTEIAAHLGPALRNADLHRTAEERASRLAILNELNRKITENLNLEEVLDEVVQAVVRLLKGNTSRIFLLREDSDKMVLQSWDGDIPAPPEGGRFQRGQGLIGRMLQTGKPVIEADVQQNPEWVTNEWVKKHGLHSYIAHPLRQEGRIIGAINCVAKEKNFFVQEDLDLLGSLASQAAIAIKNAEIHSRLEKSFEELRRSQQMIVRAEKLSSIGTLTAGAAHEILNPTNIIGLHGQRLLWENEEGSQEYETAEVIVRNVERISRICDDLRRFSRDDAPQHEPFDLNRTLRDSLRPLESELRLSNIRLETDFPEGEQLVLGDRNQVQQVIINIFSNAMDAMPEGGALTVSSGEFVEKDQRWWEIRVTDTGEGISEEIMQKLFDPFFTTKPEDQGTGLGLSVSYGIVEAHGGALWAESVPGEGATFIVRLPIQEEEE